MTSLRRVFFNDEAISLITTKNLIELKKKIATAFTKSRNDIKL